MFGPNSYFLVEDRYLIVHIGVNENANMYFRCECNIYYLSVHEFVLIATLGLDGFSKVKILNSLNYWNRYN
jgi:hypothetical protein